MQLDGVGVQPRPSRRVSIASSLLGFVVELMRAFVVVVELKNGSDIERASRKVVL